MIKWPQTWEAEAQKEKRMSRDGTGLRVGLREGPHLGKGERKAAPGQAQGGEGFKQKGLSKASSTAERSNKIRSERSLLVLAIKR